jgi:hypothetical protein
MIKVLVVRDAYKITLRERFFGKIFDARIAQFYGGDTALAIIENETPTILSLKIKKPVNGETMYNVLGQFDQDDRLRVTIYHVTSFKKAILNLSSGIKEILFPAKVETQQQAVVKK